MAVEDEEGDGSVMGVLGNAVEHTSPEGGVGVEERGHEFGGPYVEFDV